MFSFRSRGIRKTNGSGHGQKQRQTVSNSLCSNNLTACLKSLPGSQLFLIPLPKSAAHSPPPGRKVFAIGAVFCSIQIGNYCLNRLKETKARPEGFTNNKVFKPRRFAGAMCIYSRSIIESVSEQKRGVRGRVEISEGNTTRP